MIWGTWAEPNFKFTAKDKQGHPHEHFCYAATENDLRARLVLKGLVDISIESYDFSIWKKRAQNSTDKVIWQRVRDRWSYFQIQIKEKWPWLTNTDLADINGSKKQFIKIIQKHDGCDAEAAALQIDQWSRNLAEENPAPGQTVPKTAITFNEDVWKELKWHLFELFHGKCAYCENKPLPGYSGAVEHYRPKGKVDEDINHPGYYWLAYDESNLLPSCKLCNEWLAKMTHFPVAGVHSRDSRNMHLEKPLLLNPYDKTIDPFIHIEFDGTGASQPINGSPYGENSRTFYHLDRPGLSEDRFAQMQLLEQDWNYRVGPKVSIPQAYNELHEEILRGDREYSAAQLWQLDRLRRRTIDELSAAPGIGIPAANTPK